MCGIVGAVAERNVVPILMEGLRRLEYRGYDSAGLAVMEGERLSRVRRLGKVQELQNALDETPLHGGTGISHTRWATHGAPSEINAHPHMSRDDIAVVHNGIIENFMPLRAELEAAGVDLKSDTDSEVVAHLLAREMEQGPESGDFVASCRAVLRRLEGAFTLVFSHAAHPDTLVAARRSTPRGYPAATRGGGRRPRAAANRSPCRAR